jgi:excinuclease UvrABC ATPase subunit
LDSLTVTGQKSLSQRQRDRILDAHEAELKQDITRAGTEMIQMEHSARQLTLGERNTPDEESERSKQELLQELTNQQCSNTSFRKMCEEALSTTVYERTGQRINGVKATNDSSAVAGLVNASGEQLKIHQDISDVTAENRSFAAAGVINGMDFTRFGRHSENNGGKKP